MRDKKIIKEWKKQKLFNDEVSIRVSFIPKLLFYYY